MKKWVHGLLYVLGWHDAYREPTLGTRTPDREREEKRSRLDRALRRHDIDNDGAFNARLAALDAEIANERRPHAR